MKLAKQIGVIALALVMVVGLIGCGTKEATTSPAADASAQPEAASSVLNVMTEVEVASLDPQVATDGTSFEVIADYTDGLMQMDATGKAVKALCSEETVSEDGMTYTFTIRDDANWSNGDPVTADDFVFG